MILPRFPRDIYRRLIIWACGTFGIAWAASASGDDPWCVYPAGTGPGSGRHIVLVSGDEEYRSEEALPMLGKILSQRHGFKCTVLFAMDPVTGTIDPNEQRNIPGMEAIASADLVILALRFRTLSDEQMKYFAEHVYAGKPVIGLRTATHAFRYPAESTSPYRHFGWDQGPWPGGFGKQVLGETWVSHHGNHGSESTRGVVNPDQREHPVLRGVTGVWGPTDVYGINRLPDDATILLNGQVVAGMKSDDPPVSGTKNEPMMPLAWTRAYTSDSGRVARVFCTTMGASQDFSNAGLRRLVINACYWCLGLETEIPPESNVDFIDEYAPTPFGFDRFQRGKKPADYDLKSAAGPTSNGPGSDVRASPLRTLDSHFPFEPPASLDAWRIRAAAVRERIAVSLGLYPFPRRTPLNGVIHSRRAFGDYSIEKVYFESLPGFFVTGSLFRPLKAVGRHPGILCPHGHWANGRFYDAGPEAAAREIVSRAEFDPEAARVPLQARCVHLARMGCVVLHYDMIGFADSQQIGHEIAHGFARQRRDMNSPSAWGLFSPPAESRLQSVMGLQTWNSIRALDLLECLPDVDRSRIGVTGASGGGTQTMILAALDDRVSVAFPAVMVSTSMQGGCTCENAPYLRIGTGNVEFAALFAPKPQGLTAADDWTRDMARDGFPQLQSVYCLFGAAHHVRLSNHTEFGHNYNAVSRKAMYEVFNDAFGLNASTDERPFQRLTTEELSVWDAWHPRPAGGTGLEKALLQTWDRDSRSQLGELAPNDPVSAADLRQWLKPFQRVVFGEAPSTADISRVAERSTETDGCQVVWAQLVHGPGNERIPIVELKPESDRWNGRTLVWLSVRGRAVFGDASKLTDDATRLVAAGFRVVALDCFWQGGQLPEGHNPNEFSLVDNSREAAAYTFGYNHPVFVHRVRDAMAAIVHAAQGGSAKVDVLAVDGLGPVAAAAGALLGAQISRAAIDTGGFRFASVADLHDVNFLPGGARYGDLPMLLGLHSPRALWLRGEPARTTWTQTVYRAEHSAALLQHAAESADPIEWLIASAADRN